MKKEEVHIEKTLDAPQAPLTKMIAYELETVNQVADYLTTRPWKEVNGFIHLLQQGREVEV